MGWDDVETQALPLFFYFFRRKMVSLNIVVTLWWSESRSFKRATKDFSFEAFTLKRQSFNGSGSLDLQEGNSQWVTWIYKKTETTHCFCSFEILKREMIHKGKYIQYISISPQKCHCNSIVGLLFDF